MWVPATHTRECLRGRWFRRARNGCRAATAGRPVSRAGSIDSNGYRARVSGGAGRCRPVLANAPSRGPAVTAVVGRWPTSRSLSMISTDDYTAIRYSKLSGPTERRSLLSLMPPRAGKTRVVAHPDEVVGPQIEHPLEITFAVALVALPQRVRLAGDATLLSSAEIPTKATGQGSMMSPSRYRDRSCCARRLRTDRWVR